MKLRVNRPFIFDSVPQKIGAEIELDDRGLIAMLLSTGKASPVDDYVVSGPMTTESTSAVVAGEPAKRGRPQKQNA